MFWTCQFWHIAGALKIIGVSDLESKVLLTENLQDDVSMPEFKPEEKSEITIKTPKAKESKVLPTNEDKNLKKIYFWTSLFSLEDWGFGFGQKPFERCPESNCLTTNEPIDYSMLSGFQKFLNFSALCFNQWLDPEVPIVSF